MSSIDTFRIGTSATGYLISWQSEYPHARGGVLRRNIRVTLTAQVPCLVVLKRRCSRHEGRSGDGPRGDTTDSLQAALGSRATSHGCCRAPASRALERTRPDHHRHGRGDRWRTPAERILCAGEWLRATA